jgi:hypothetical protein
MLVDALNAELPRLRAEAESIMVDAVTITRAGAPVFDPNTGTYTPGVVAVYSGPCRVRPLSGTAMAGSIGDLDSSLTHYVISLPSSADGIERDDIALITASSDADLVNRPLTVASVPLKTWSASRRIIVEDRT